MRFRKKNTASDDPEESKRIEDRDDVLALVDKVKDAALKVADEIWEQYEEAGKR